LTGGVPEIVDMDSSANPGEIWSKIKAAQKVGALLGCGTPSHPEGDKARSTQGIVLQHAYSLLKAEEVDGTKLVMIRNPHGGGEWVGDWSDKSSKWSKRMRNMLNYHDNKDDGVFWMELSDFMTEYDAIYICTVFGKEQGW
jgi:calpain-15